MSTQIQLRRGTRASWASANPILAAGEPGYETDTGRIKVGDGATAWNSLAVKVTQSGSVDITPTASTPTSGSVTFPVAFGSAPVVVVSANSAFPGSQVQGVSVGSVTTSGCTVWLYRTNTTTTTIYWVAVGEM